MNENQRFIVVPWDFTPVADNALAHAVRISGIVKNEIALLHIIEAGRKPQEEKEKKVMLQKIADDTFRKYNIPVSWFVVKGSIFSSIAEFVNEKDATLVIMGTHGIKGMQKLTGSWALKVIIKSKVPFIVIQDPPHGQGKFNNIVFPVDFRKENKEKIKMAIYMGKYFDSKIHILVTTSADKTLIKKTKINLAFAVKYFIQNNIEYEVHEIPKGKSAERTIEFAQKIDADLILIITTKNITLADYALGAAEQHIIANSSRIPVCCVNPKTSFASSRQFMGGWGD